MAIVVDLNDSAWGDFIIEVIQAYFCAFIPVAIYMENGYFHHLGLRECVLEQSFNQVCILLDSELVNQPDNLFVCTTTFPLSQFG